MEEVDTKAVHESQMEHIGITKAYRIIADICVVDTPVVKFVSHRALHSTFLSDVPTVSLWPRVNPKTLITPIIIPFVK